MTDFQFHFCLQNFPRDRMTPNWKKKHFQESCAYNVTVYSSTVHSFLNPISKPGFSLKRLFKENIVGSAGWFICYLSAWLIWLSWIIHWVKEHMQCVICFRFTQGVWGAKCIEVKKFSGIYSQTHTVIYVLYAHHI